MLAQCYTHEQLTEFALQSRHNDVDCQVVLILDVHAAVTLFYYFFQCWHNEEFRGKRF